VNKKVCYFDNNRECPVRKAFGMSVPLLDFIKIACTICPIREKMMKSTE